MDSLKIAEFKKAIIDFTNQTQLPLEVKRLVFSEILKQLEVAANEEIKIQAETRKETKEKESEET